MANEILLLDSFDRYAAAGASAGTIGTVWSRDGAPVPGRFFGGNAASFTNFGGFNASSRFSPGFHPQACLGAAIKIPSRGLNLLNMTNSVSGGSLTLNITTNGRMAVSTTQADFTPIALGNQIDTMAIGAWHYVEFAASHGLNGAQTLRGWVDGALVLEALNVSTFNTLGFDSFGVCTQPTNVVYDDFYAKDGITPLGEIKIETLNLNADTATAGFVINGTTFGFDALDELIVDGDSTYISSSVPGTKSLFEIQNLSETPEAIKAVQLRSYGRKLDAGYRSLKNVIKSGAVEGLGAENVLATTYTFQMDIFEKNPNGNIPWTEAAVNGMQVGALLYA